MTSMSDTQRSGRLDEQRDRLQRIALLVVDEVGLIRLIHTRRP